MRKLFLSIAALLCVGSLTGALHAQVANPAPYPAGTKVNYVRSWDAKAREQSTATLQTRPLADVTQSTQYLDGLGRPIQTVIKQITPLGKDLVTPMVYDVYGREKYKYLPFASNVFLAPDITNDGNFKMSPFQQDSVFNKAQFPGETYFYSRSAFAASPIDRMDTMFAPGNSWVGSNRGVVTQYFNNTLSDSVQIWNIADANASIPTSAGVYAAGTLSKTITIDEAGHQVVEYKDKLGMVILKKVQLWNTPGAGHSGWLCTYYVYDDFVNLRFVIQPKAVELLRQAGNWTISTAMRDELCFYYSYDDHKKPIIKKVPGAGEEWMVYDIRERLVMTQDSNLRARGQWYAMGYDSQDRPYNTGLAISTQNRVYHQSQAATQTDYPYTGSNYIGLSATYYDNYSWIGGSGIALTSNLDQAYTSNGSYFVTTYNASPVNAQPITQYKETRNMVTGKFSATPGQYVWTAFFFDDHGRTIQVQQINYTGGRDVVTTQYDFANRPLRILEQHTKNGTNAQSHKVLTKNSYDAGGRLLTVYKNVDSAASDQLVATNTYNELGQLQNKADGNAIENLGYAYNIRGWMTSINKNYLTSGNGSYFGMELAYDKTAAAVSSTSYTTAQYNGNITGTIWKSKGDGVNRKYDFTYDNVNRLTGANFNQNATGTTWSNAVINYTVGNLTYDFNGNILTMNQNGFKLMNSPLVDQLTYTYQTNSNKLSQVTDGANDSLSKLGDFHYSTKQSTDYTYNGNGSLITDNNKKISSIKYNYRNQPDTIFVTGKGTISYVYDADGNKLKKTTVEGAKTTTTLYIGNFVYVNDTLQFINHEEGRIRWAYHKYLNGSSAYKFEYDYFLKDHLGNVRMILTQQKDTAQYLASMEAAYRTTEKQLFYNIPPSNYSRAAVSGYPSDPTTNPNDSLMRLNGSGQKVGAAIVLKVMSGDVIDVAVKAYYANQTYSAPNNSFTDALNALANGIVQASSGSKGVASDFTNPSGLAYGSLNTFMTTNEPTITNKPRAYLNWVLLDEQFNYTSASSGALAVGNYASNTLNTLATTGLPVVKNGYLYIFVNNETPGWDVFFDNLSIKHYAGPLLEETHYYPFGLTMAGISSKALKPSPGCGCGIKKGFNSNEFQNKEFIDGSGLEMYDFNARTYDQQIGRFIQIDPITDEGGQESLSPYHFSYNNPIRYNDPDGKCPWCIGAIVGAAVEYASQVAANRLEGKSWKESLTDVDGKAIAIAAGTGALTGGVSAFVPKGVVGTVLKKGAEMAIDAGESMMQQYNETGKVSTSETIKDVLVNQAAGAVTAKIKPLQTAETKGNLDRAERIAAKDPSSSGRAATVKNLRDDLSMRNSMNQATMQTATGAASKTIEKVIMGSDGKSKTILLYKPYENTAASDNTARKTYIPRMLQQ